MAGALSEVHELQVQGYLRFSRFKREQHLREVDICFKDVKDMKLDEPVYNKEDVLSIIDGLASEIDRTVAKELENMAHANALLLRQLLLQAQEVDFEMYADTAQLENMDLLAEIRKSDMESLHKPASAFAVKAQRLNRITGKGTDPKIVLERDSLRDEVAALKDKFEKLQTQTTTMLKEKTKINDDFNKLKDEMKLKETAVSSKDKELERATKEAAELKASLAAAETATRSLAGQAQNTVSNEVVAKLEKKIKDLEASHAIELSNIKAELNTAKLEVDAANKVVDAKLQESKPFLTMKKMMQTKSNQLVELRKRLAKYEPDDTPSADDD
eukprot:jgi/Mesvir1/29412/Mv22998-RA.1